MPKTQTVTILFCDLVSSTERRSRQGDDAADVFVARLKAALRDAVARHDGREFKDVGDGIQASFERSAADAVSCAIDMHRDVATLDPDDPPRLRIGISTGEVAPSGTDWSGTPVVEAARLEAAAQPGQTLANAVVRSLVGTRRALRFRDVGALRLKGLPDPLATVEVVHEDVAAIPPAPAPAVPRPPRHRTGLLVGVIACGLVVAIAGVVFALTRSSGADHTAAQPGRGPTGYVPRFVTTSCPPGTRRDVPDATCGDLVVPQDRTQLKQRWIHISVLRAPARVKTSAPPTIDIGGGEEAATSPVRDHADLIQLSDRGFPLTKPALSCPEAEPALKTGFAHPVGDPTATDALVRAIKHCRARLTGAGIVPADYNLEAVTQDALDLMDVLHIRSADLVSGPADTMAVFGVARLAPDAVRSVTLENPFPPGDGFLTNPVGDLASAFTTYGDLCAKTPPCAAAYPDLRRTFAGVRAHYAAARPVVSASCACNPSLPPVPVLVDGPRATDALEEALASSDTYGAIPAAISPRPLDNVIAPYARQHSITDLEGDQLGANLSYICSYFVHVVDGVGSAIARRTYPEFVGTDASAPWSAWCKAWNVPDLSEQLSVDVASQVPALLLRGSVSPYGDPQWIDQLARALPNATVATFPTLGNDVLVNGPRCLNDLRRQFLADPSADIEHAAAACVANSPPIPFAVPGS